MQAVYDLAARWADAGLLPAVFQHAFMVRGLLAALIIGPLLGAVGTLVVAKRLVFFTQTVGHGALTGVALGLLLGEPIGGTYAGLYGFCLGVALVMTYLRHRVPASTDAIVGVVLAQILGLGIIAMVLVTKQYNVHQVEAVLFGSLIALTDRDLLVLAGTALLSAGVLAATFNPVMLATFSPALARTRGIRPEVYEYVFVAMATLVVVASLKLVGALLVLVLIVIPAATARALSRGLVGFFWCSVGAATVSTVAGLMLSAWLPIPTGAAIVVAASALFYLALPLRWLRRA